MLMFLYDVIIYDVNVTFQRQKHSGNFQVLCSNSGYGLACYACRDKSSLVKALVSKIKQIDFGKQTVET